MSKVSTKELSDTFGDVEEAYIGSGRKPIAPEAEYSLQITEAAVKPGKKLPYVQAKAVITDSGDYEGRQVNIRMFLNPETKALAITRATLSVIFNGKVPKSIAGKSKFDTDNLAAAIADALANGPTFKGYVGIEASDGVDDKGNPWPAKNVLLAKKG